MSYHGLLSLGTLGKRAYILNNLLLDPFSLGNDSDATRQAEFIPSGEKDQYGKARMNWIFSYPNPDVAWKISNNYYVISDSGQAFYDQFASAGVTGEGAPLTWHINGKLGADSVNAFKKVTLKLGRIPGLMTQLNRWYRAPNGGKKAKNTPGAWTYGSATDPNDYDRKGYAWLRDSLDCTYSTSSPVYTGGTGGYPVGDLNWFPTKKAAWLLSPPSAVEQADVIPAAFSLAQNYPNPFNPSTTLEFSIPKSSHVVLEVFNVLGQSVARLVDGAMSAGTYRTAFDASNLSSGVYLYRLKAGEFVQARKMVVMK
jgi:hypothetical protein